MDFGKPLKHDETDNLVARSNIRVLPETTESSLDNHLICAANQAATNIFGSSSYNHESFPSLTLHQSTKIQPNDLVVVFESFDNLSFVYATPGKTFSNRNGDFSHSSFIGMPWGSKIRSTSHEGYGYVYLLKPTPELWARSLKHRTQIIHELDASLIIMQLWIKPNMRVVESGTGSGALSHALLRTLAPHGHLDTFEFHVERSKTAQQEFQNHNLSHLVTVHHKDVCGKNGKGGFDLEQTSVDAVVLDLPEPWLAVPHAAFCLKRGARLASYSPCVEQAQKTILALQKSGFHSIKTMEYRLREYHVDQVPLESPPTELREGRGAIQDKEITDAQQQDEKKQGSSVAVEGESNEPASDSKKRKREDEEAAPKEGKQMLCARPFPLMRGHTAFLTFATAGNTLQPDPNYSLEEEGKVE